MDRLDRLRKWLEKVGARQMWTTRVKGIGRIDCYQIGKGIALVQIYQREAGAPEGWDVFVPASLKNDTPTTLEAAEKLLGYKLDPAAHAYADDELDTTTAAKVSEALGNTAAIAFERDGRPLKIHKGIVIRMLREDPGCLEKVLIDGFETAEEAISALEAHPAEWILDGVLRMPTPEELRAEANL